jgi:hypothetical protein
MPLHSPRSREVEVVLWYSACGFSMVERGFLVVHKALGEKPIRGCITGVGNRKRGSYFRLRELYACGC